MSYQLLNCVALYGGFAGGESALSERDYELNTTTLSGDLAENDGPNFENTAENSLHVLLGDSTNQTAILDGFVVRGGNANGSTSSTDSGGGIFTQLGGPQIRNTTFIGNRANNVGGAAMNDRSSIAFDNCRFESNQASQAGAVYSGGTGLPRVQSFRNTVFTGNHATGLDGGAVINDFGASGQFVNCVFTSNTANRHGGAVDNNAQPSDPRFENCWFSGNSAGVNGGAIQSGTHTVAVNCVMTGNSAGFYGGGLAQSDFSSLTCTLINCTLASNTAISAGGGAYIASTSSCEVRNCVLWSNTDAGGQGSTSQLYSFTSGFVTVSYSCNQGLVLFGTGNINSNPLFVDADGDDNIAGTIDDDLMLLDGSPSIDAARNSDLPLDSLDLDADGNTTEPIPLDFANSKRRLDDPDTTDSGAGTPPIVDMGAFEFKRTCAGLLGDFTLDGLLRGDDISGFVNCYLMGPSLQGDCLCADLDQDNDVDDEDVNCVVSHLLDMGGCQGMFAMTGGGESSALEEAAAGLMDESGSSESTEPSFSDQFGATGSFGVTDCDGNNRSDLYDLRFGPLTGGTDCNDNGTLDECDIESGISVDQNQNGFPDECDAACSVTLAEIDPAQFMAKPAHLRRIARLGFFEWSHAEIQLYDETAQGSLRFSRMVQRLRELELPVRRQ